MPSGDGYDWYAAGSIAGGVVGVEHITIVLRQEWQDMSRVAGL